MSRTDEPTAPEVESHVDTEVSTQLSGGLFDEVLMPLAAARTASGAQPYFPRWRGDDDTSYFVPPGVRRMTPADFEFPGGGSPEGLIDALAARWLADEEAELSAAAPYLKAIAEALRTEALHHDGSVDIFCYTLF
jgi:hypothetical protein